ncbi:MAG: sporulation protein YunB [Clostridia bacterium]|nr:sporulation protein YunB [Clostridia bacterium]
MLRFRKYSGRFIYAVNIRKIFWFIILLVFLAGLVITTYSVQQSFIPVVTVTAKTTAVREVENIIDSTVLTVIEQNDVSYNSLYRLKENDSGVVSAVESNTKNINLLKSQLSISINEKMGQLQEKTLQIPLGSIFSSAMFTGWGPKIPIKINRVGYASIDIDGDFVSAGVNQTKHNIVASVNAQISIILMKQNITINIETTVPVTETVIVGEVPSIYRN